MFLDINCKCVDNYITWGCVRPSWRSACLAEDRAPSDSSVHEVCSSACAIPVSAWCHEVHPTGLDFGASSKMAMGEVVEDSVRLTGNRIHHDCDLSLCAAEHHHHLS